MTSLQLYAVLLALILIAAQAFHVQTKTSRANLGISMKIDKKKFIAQCLLSSAFLFPTASFAIAQQYKLPPIDYKDPNRCVLSSSSVGQANAARDKLFDVRECDLRSKK